MIIALDYDDTWTRDPDAWYQAAMIMKQAGHTIYGVTLRYPREASGMDMRYDKVCKEIIFTSREAKWYYTRNRGILIDVWIDDSPHFILRGAQK
jgi:hypothetical protein